MDSGYREEKRRHREGDQHVGSLGATEPRYVLGVGGRPVWLDTESGGEECRRRRRSGPRPDCAEPRGRVMACSGFPSGRHGTLCATRASLWPCGLQEQEWKQVEGYSVVSQGMVEHLAPGNWQWS